MGGGLNGYNFFYGWGSERLLVIYYSTDNHSFVVNSINSDTQALAIPINGQIQTKDLIQFINRATQCSGGFLRLYCHANLGELNSKHVTPIVNAIAHGVKPLSLYLFHTKEGQIDATRYLNRLSTAAGLCLPKIDMRGCCISEELVRQSLTSSRSSTILFNHLQKLLNEAPELAIPTQASTRGAWLSTLPFAPM